MESSQDKNLPATERKLQKTRDNGQAARSRDLGHLAVLGVGALCVLFGGPALLEQLRLALGQQLSFDAHTLLAPQLMLERLVDMAWMAVTAVIVFALIINAASLVSGVLAGGWVLSFKPILPQFKRINPLSGLGNLFSKQQMVTALKNVLLTLILALIAWLHIRSGIAEMAALPAQASPQALSLMASWIASGVAMLLLVILAMAVIDVPLQTMLFKQRLKMSHQEVKQEHKESEGSPELKGKIRQKQREMAHRASIQRVPQADFIVTNPTHYAVALRYDEANMAAPQVIAKGSDLLALKIREVAKANDVLILESPMLARALYAHAELDQSIPAALYNAVAQVLAYVYRLRASLRGEGPTPEPLVPPQVPEALDPHASARANATESPAS